MFLQKKHLIHFSKYVSTAATLISVSVSNLSFQDRNVCIAVATGRNITAEGLFEDPLVGVPLAEQAGLLVALHAQQYEKKAHEASALWRPGELQRNIL